MEGLGDRPIAAKNRKINYSKPEIVLWYYGRFELRRIIWCREVLYLEESSFFHT